MISCHLMKRFNSASALYIRLAKPLRTFEERFSRSSLRPGWFFLLVEECLIPGFERSQARRIIFCDSCIVEKTLKLHDSRLAQSLLAENTEAEDSESVSDEWEDEDSYRAKYRRPVWASVYVGEISFRNCHVFFQSVPHWRIEISCASMDTLIFYLDGQDKCWDLICAAWDAYNEEPGSSERRKVKKSMLKRAVFHKKANGVLVSYAVISAL